MPPMMFPSTLFSKLTQNIQARNEAGFLSLVAPAARPAVRMWWENLQAIGFTTGAIGPPSSSDSVRLDSHGDGTLTVLAGMHSPLDPVPLELGGVHGKPEIPCETYQLGLHFASPTATGEITSWKPLGNAPWDQGVRLYVRKARHLVVAGPPGDKTIVDQTLPLAKAAADFDGMLVDQVNSNDLLQQGFVVFVSGSSATRDRWFSTGPQPKRWPAEFLGGLTFPLPGPNEGGASLFNSLLDSNLGGARVIITPYQDDGQTPHGETAQLVRQFMLDILAPHDQQQVAAGPILTPDWALEGLAVAVQGLYEGGTNPTAPVSPRFVVLTNALRALPASYRAGHLPTTQQLFSGSAATQQDWNDVAASVYEYIALKAGMNQLFASAMLLWERFSTPFGNVLASQNQQNGGTLKFYTGSFIEAGWRAALARL
jgi:hypothetical protein